MTWRAALLAVLLAVASVHGIVVVDTRLHSRQDGWHDWTRHATSCAQVDDVLAQKQQLPATAVSRETEACLAASHEACRPLRPSRLHNLTAAEHRTEMQRVALSTAALRAVPWHVYANHGGPWMEAHFARCFFRRPASTWFPLVPVFVSYTSAVEARRQGDGSYADALDRLFRVDDGSFRTGGIGSIDGKLDPALRYVLFVEHANGPLPHMRDCKHFHNVLVISSGGWGSVPVPHITGQDLPLAAATTTRQTVLSFQGRTTYLLRNVSAAPGDAAAAPALQEAGHGGVTLHGALSNGTSGGDCSDCQVLTGYSALRPRMIRDLRAAGASNERLLAVKPLEAEATTWQRLMHESALVLAPRGFGPTSFRLFEALQMGRVPVYLWQDVEWLPYRRLGERVWGSEGVALTTQLSDVGALWHQLCRLFQPAVSAPGQCTIPVDDNGRIAVPETSVLARMERRLASMRANYFTVAGVLGRVAEFLLDPTASALACEGKYEMRFEALLSVGIAAAAAERELAIDLQP